MKTVTVNSDNKDDAYVATVLMFNQVAIMARNKIGGWSLSESYTSFEDKHYITEYTNGKMWINATSVEEKHIYTFGAE
ncbi:hypothetical protein NVP1213O_54 [Vibrio phage 1.213.O._10N.222.54.F10]|nr:hypothetical protein NVP1213O_54 [Vibrio phage 1.213.O._10N.222.54.F10]